MKRKIAAIMAADIAGYSKLVAEDEEETLRRLASYRAVFNDFIARGSGRVFNTAGDSILAEFPSAVEAVRCAIDVQESLRTRNLAYPLSRQMNFRIGVTIGDVVERDGDLLGDGVNIAARLEGLAAPGGICVSRAVFEQVENKLSVQFADIGEQEMKNIPMPVHAYTLALGAGDRTIQGLRSRKSAIVGTGPIAVLAATLAALTVAAFFYHSVLRDPAATGGTTVTPAAPTAQTSSLPAQSHIETLTPETVPFISDRERAAIRNEYLPGQDFKALAISYVRMGFTTGQKDEATAKAAALESCRKASAASGASGTAAICELYAVGSSVLFKGGHPPLPPKPWVRRDPSIERSFSSEHVPLINEERRAALGKGYVPAATSKALALSPRVSRFYIGQSKPEEAMRRALEACGSISRSSMHGDRRR